MKKIISFLFAILLISSSTGCGGEKDDATNNKTKMTTFDNYYITFTHPIEYEPDENANELDSYSTLYHKDGGGYISVSMDDILDEPIEKRKDQYVEFFDDPDKNYGYEKAEELTVDGRKAWLVYFGMPRHRISFLIVEYSADNFIVFDFYLNSDGNEDQITKDIIDSIKIKQNS